MFLKDQLDNKDTDLVVLLHHSGIEDLTTATELIEFHKQVVHLRRDQGNNINLQECMYVYVILYLTVWSYIE